MNLREAMTVLGVHEPFDENTIARAFKTSVRINHPDVGGRGGTDMARLTKAKKVLLDSLVKCKKCNGTGAQLGFKCAACGGRGK